MCLFLDWNTEELCSNLCLFLFAVVGVAQDVTEDRKHAQVLREMQYMRASQEAKVETERNMTAYFAHELRNRKLLARSNYTTG